MHEMQTIVTYDRMSVRQSVCLSRGSTRLYCAKTAQRIKILFGVNTLGGPRNIMLDGGPDPPQRGGGVGEISPIVDQLHISRLAEITNLKFCVHIHGWGP